MTRIKYDVIYYILRIKYDILRIKYDVTYYILRIKYDVTYYILRIKYDVTYYILRMVLCYNVKSTQGMHEFDPDASDDEDFQTQYYEEFSCYTDLETLLGKPAHLAIFLNYTIMQNKPNYLVSFYRI